jgi:hypothetical protein
MTTTMLAKSRYSILGMHTLGGVTTGVVDVDWVYNPMPPVPGQVYPPEDLKTVIKF